MLPYVEAHQRLHAVTHRVAGVLLRDDGQLARFILGEPCPSRTEKTDGSLLHLGLELLERTEIRVDSLQQRPCRTRLAIRRKLVEEELVIPHLRSVVENRAVGRNDDVLQRLPGVRRIENQLVEFIHIPHVMLVVVETQRLFGDLRCESVVSVRQLLGGKPCLCCNVCCHNRKLCKYP